MQRIVIIGGGAGGIGLATRLGRRLGRRGRAHVTLVDRVESHLWKPLLHELATGALDEGIDAVSFRGHARANGYHFQQGELASIDRARREVVLASLYEGKHLLLPERRIAYDYLIIAVGSVSDDFDIRGVGEHCVFLDDAEQALGLRKKLRQVFLRYASQEEPDRPIRIAVIGAGATGAELAAEMHHAVDQLRGFGFRIDQGLFDITLIEAEDRILPRLYPAGVADSVMEQLDRIGVKVCTGKRVVRVGPELVQLEHGEPIPAEIVIWAAGIKAPDMLSGIGGLETNESNQLVVRPTCQTTRDDRIFAIGDCSALPQADGTLVPPRGQAARQEGHLVAANIRHMLNGHSPRKEYVYRDLGALVNLSNVHTVGNLFSFLGGGFKVEGRIARFTYASLYRRHIIEVFGPFKGILMLGLKALNRWIRPHLKLH